MRLFLDISQNNKLLKTVHISKSRVRVGRSKGDIILKDPRISPLHLELRIENGRIIVEDLKSQNGTEVSGKLISTPYTVKKNDTVLLNPFSLCFRIESNSHVLEESFHAQETEEPNSPSKLVEFHDTFRPHSYELKALNN